MSTQSITTINGTITRETVKEIVDRAYAEAMTVAEWDQLDEDALEHVWCNEEGDEGNGDIVCAPLNAHAEVSERLAVELKPLGIMITTLAESSGEGLELARVTHIDEDGTYGEGVWECESIWQASWGGSPQNERFDLWTDIKAKWLTTIFGR